MALKAKGKRPAQPVQVPSKKRKLAPGWDAADGRPAKSSKTKSKGKEKAMDRGTIPIPNAGNEDDVELSDEGVDMLEEFGNAISFLGRLDEKGIARSKKETERLHQLHKPVRKVVEDDLPSIDSHSEDEESWDSNIDEDDNDNNAEEDEDLELFNSDGASSSSASSSRHARKQKRKVDSDDDEMPYEAVPRKRRSSWDPESDKEQAIERLPIKLADGRIQKGNGKVVLEKAEQSEEEDDETGEEESQPQQPQGVEDVSTGARFGRPAVIDVIKNKSRKARILGAKEQIAGICQDIVSDPENSLGLLRRLHTFSLPEISTPTHPEPVPNDTIIRRLTLLSQLAVFKDIIPGYRIRALTEKEKAEKVSQMVQRTRDWEKGLVSVYQAYLHTLEAEIKGKSELAEVALQCMCTLLVEATHFNFRVNLVNSIVASLSRKSWDKSSDLCLNSIIRVVRADNTGEPSLEIVRLLNRMIKERRFNVHPEVLSCLVHLRLKTELGVRASEWRADKEQVKTQSKGRAAARRAKGKSTEQPHLSKKAKKVMKEKQEIRKEMREAEAEVDKEERAAIQTETLKLLFVLYFRILKNPRPTPLLPAALRGIAKFAHLVNIDFFKDLMQVLKDIMAREDDSGAADGPNAASESAETKRAQDQLLCIVTAFELLSGQGEALDIDLTDFINRLYAIIPPLSVAPTLESPPRATVTASGPPSTRAVKPPTTADTLFRALALAFAPRTSVPPWRAAAFVKRLLGAALHWPPASAARALEFVGAQLERAPQLEALLSTDERAGNGAHRPDLDDPQLSNPFGATLWELRLLARHADVAVRERAGRILQTLPS